MRKIIALLLPVLGSVLSVNGQSLNHIGLMPTIDHSGAISKRLEYSLYYFAMVNLYNDKVNGLTDDPGIFDIYSEQALTYKATKQLSFTASYVYERQRPFDNNYRNENRFYLQSTYKYTLGKTEFRHRLRFDGRFIEDPITRATPFTHRVRYLTGVSLPISKAGKLYFSAYNEFFFNTHAGADVIYGENWVYAAVGFKTGKTSSIETGPLHVFWITDKQNTFKRFTYLQVSWNTHLDFTKKANRS